MLVGFWPMGWSSNPHSLHNVFRNYLVKKRESQNGKSQILKSSFGEETPQRANS
jgi:hypothetical protein